MNGKELRDSLLQWAIRGRLVEQRPSEEPAAALLQRIRDEKRRLTTQGKLRRDPKETVIFRGADGSFYEKSLTTGKTPQCIDDEIPFEIPKSWEWARLGELAIYKKGPFGSSLTKSMFVPRSDKSIKVYEQKNAIKKDYRLGEYYISQEKFTEMQGFIVKPKDIIVSCAGTIGETYQLPLDAPIGIINQALMRVTPHIDDIALYWMLYFRYILLKESKMKGAGSAIKNIPPFDYLKSILIPIPPLAEQERIVRKLEELLPLVERYGRAQEELDRLNGSLPRRLKASILQEAVRGRLVPQIPSEGSAQELLSRIEKQRQRLVGEGKLRKTAAKPSTILRHDDGSYHETSAGRTTCIDDQIPFPIPPTWQWVRGRNIFLPMESTKPKGDTFVYVDVDAVNNKLNIIDKAKTLPTSKAPSRASRKLHLGDVLFSMVRPYLRNIALIDERFSSAIASTGFYVLTPLDGVTSRYLFYLMTSPYVVDGLNAYMKGENSPSINNSHIEEFLYPLPPIAEQARIVKKIEELFSLIP